MPNAPQALPGTIGSGRLLALHHGEGALDGGYVGAAGALLRAAGARVGDRVEVRRADGSTGDAGLLMPHHEFSGEDVVVLKLENGYNIGLAVGPSDTVAVVSRAVPRAPPAREVPRRKGLPDIAIVGTGGTIASYVDYRTGAVHPALTAEELAFSVPGLADRYNLRAEALLSVHSEDLWPHHWAQIARAVAAHLGEGAAGVVVPHGTDTMGYTAAALAFMLPELSGPVVLVGSQRSSDRPSSDAVENLEEACAVATADLGEVVVAMHAGTSDGAVAVHRGTRVRKMHTSARYAFASVNAEPIGRVAAGAVAWQGAHRPRAARTSLDDRFDDRVGVLYVYPGFDPELVHLAARRWRGIVVAGTGLGHMASHAFVAVREAVKAGVVVVMTSQCLFGSTNMNVYTNGRDLLRTGVVPMGDMLPETALAKLACLLGRTEDPDEVRRMMLEDMAGEVGPRRPLGGGFP
jgi:glutamyl-tRNA(Gln) amidotransferase subunit D